MQPTCNDRFEPGLPATIKLKKTNVFLTAVLVSLREPETVCFLVKKAGKEFKVNLSNSPDEFFNNLYQSSQPSIDDYRQIHSGDYQV
ncbi:hypothetical protein LC653_28980 [Nostoc sp. CHAB 5784]|nr:hypothetical protein [Nostoc mirabile CHAB5784]